MPPRRPADVPVVPWSAFWPYFAREYKVSADSADHVSIFGPTGTGKTTLAMEIASLRRYVVALGTKPKDRPFRDLTARAGYKLQRSGDLPSAKLRPRVLVWPEYSGISDARRQHDVFASVFDQAFRRGGWHIVAEEAPHLDLLGLRPRLRQHLTMARTMSSGLILCAQRPVGLPRETRTNVQHLFMFGTNDVEDLKTLAGLNGADSWAVRDTVARLGRGYDFLHVNTRTGKLVVSRYEPNTRKARS